MRFKSQIRNPGTFAKLCASLASIGPIAWLRINDEDVRFMVHPDKGSQVFAQISNENMFFEPLVLESAAEKNAINLQVPIQALYQVLKSAIGATSAQLRLTKKQKQPILCLTIINNSFSGGNNIVTTHPNTNTPALGGDEYGDFDFSEFDAPYFGGAQPLRDRETIINQDVPVTVLPMESVAGLHEPRAPEPDVYIHLPNLLQLKSISERFTRLAMGTNTSSSKTSTTPKLELSATMHGHLRISTKTDALSISSTWTGLINPDLEPSQFESSEELRQHPSTRMRALGDARGENEAGWATVRIDARDWARVLSVGRLNSSKVIACFIHDHGLVLYVYMNNEDDGDEELCLTYYISSFSA